MRKEVSFKNRDRFIQLGIAIWYVYNKLDRNHSDMV